MKNAHVGPVGIICLLAVNAFAADDNEKSFKPCVTLTGDDSHVSDRGYHRIQSLDDWAKVWQKHTGQNKVQYKNFDNRYDIFYNTLGLPLVDFDDYMVIAIFQGSRWNCAGLNAVSVSEEVDRITFRFEDKPYGTSGPNGGGKKVSVYGFFVLPKSGKSVILEEKVYRAKNQQAFANPLKPGFDKSKLYTTDWKQCIKFDEIKK